MYRVFLGVLLAAFATILAAGCSVFGIAERTTGPSESPTPTATVPAGTQPTSTVVVPVATAEFAFLTLRTERMPGTNPRAIRFTMEVIGGPDNNPGIYCKDVIWTFADGQVVTEHAECIPWTTESKIQRMFTFDHVYDHPGKYEVTVRIPDASLQASTTIDIP